jgi:hypothetical protein
MPLFESRRARRRYALWVAVAAAIALVLAPAAHADIGEKIILRCTHEESLSGFSQAAYRKALKELSADTEEYSNCSSLIRQAQLAAARGGGSGGGPPVSAAKPTAIAPTPSEQAAIAHAKQAAASPVPVGNQLVQPGVVHANIASAFSSLPTPLLATVIFLLACLLFVGVNAVRNPVRVDRSS